nr:phaiodactylipin [Anuroctonus phaiodactylus]
MDALERSCSQPFEEERFLIVSGTKWCGNNNIAANYSDLGFLEADKCCRDHDHCDHIASGETKYGLENKGLFTILNCDCDEAFDHCLKEISNNVTTDIRQKGGAENVWRFYFQWYNANCYRLYCKDEKSARDEACTNQYAVVKKNFTVQ